jgi:hypothetical protein
MFLKLLDTEIMTAQTLMSEFSAFEFEISIETKKTQIAKYWSKPSRIY